ncbi:MAG: toxic anion resistance protein [Desulfovibrio sp.]|jgi:uncharacterized protein YaaN involved in tellurite resistance|nr:toxic anion resistance protein [Desulfovibrio sp.]
MSEQDTRPAGDALAPIEKMLPPDTAKVKDLAASINLDDPSLTLTYGAQTMTEISRFADDLLGRVRARDAGPVGETLTDLLVKVKDANTDGLNQSPSFMERLPLVGPLFNSAQRSIARFNTLAGQVEAISGKLDASMVGLLKDIEVLEQLYEHNRVFYENLTLYIEAGEARLDEARSVELPRLQKEAGASGASMDAQKVRDFAERLNRFERRLHDLRLSRAITLQTAPQIRLIQNNDQTLAEKIQTSILSTIPIWKGQMVLALSLYRQKGAAALQKDVSDTTNKLLRKNAEMLESATVDTAREVERAVVDVDTLREVQKRLVATIEQTLRIAEEGRQKRVAAEKELKVMEEDMRARLVGLAAAGRDQAIAGAEGRTAMTASQDAIAANQTKDA